MTADQLLQSGQVDRALAVLQEEVRSRPADPKLRTFLFQLLAVLGQWDRAANQLTVLADLDPSTLLLTRLYGRLIEAEQIREQVFSGEAVPEFFGEPEPWMATLLAGNSLAAKGDFSGAGKTLRTALEAAPDSSGKIGEDSFTWIMDSDSRFGPVLEALIEGRYFWIPLFRIKQLRSEPPKQLRDLLWIPASFQWTNGGEAAGFIFARYPASHQSADPLIRLNRKTEWDERGDGLILGSGQRMLNTEFVDYPILDLRSMELHPT